MDFRPLFSMIKEVTIAVTSSGRCLISNSFTCCEQFLGGNLPIFTEQEAINLAVLIKKEITNIAHVREVMLKYNLRFVT